MWGRYVESEINDAIKNAKGDKQREIKARMRMMSLMRDPEEETTAKATPTVGKFRDPASMVNKRT